MKNPGVNTLPVNATTTTRTTQLYLKLGYVRVGEISNYASFPDGRLWAAVIFYKEL